MIGQLVEKYRIVPSFLNRYFSQNAGNRFALNQLEFMLWRRGQFIKPKDKAACLDRFIVEEIENFYIKNEINIPQLQFALTTRCSLKCRDCNALIPDFGSAGHKHIDLTFAGFKRDFDVLMSAVKNVRRFMLLGGEPLINKELPDIVDYAAVHDGIAVIEIITNGTLLPSPDLLETAKKHSDKVYFHLSNYSKNESLRRMLKYDDVIKNLKENGIKHQMSVNLVWNKEEPLRLRSYTDSELQLMFDTCWLKKCAQVLDGKLSLCPRISSGIALGLIEAPDDEFIDVRNSESIHRRIVNFYQKECFESCRYCIRIDEQILPAIQKTIRGD